MVPTGRYIKLYTFIEIIEGKKMRKYPNFNTHIGNEIFKQLELARIPTYYIHK